MYIVVPIFMLLSVLRLEAMAAAGCRAVSTGLHAGLHSTSCLVDIKRVK
jgi:hypothetical protein